MAARRERPSKSVHDSVGAIEYEKLEPLKRSPNEWASVRQKPRCSAREICASGNAERGCRHFDASLGSNYVGAAPEQVDRGP